MQINNRFIQDMYIFGDPSRIPIVIVERVMNAPRRTFSENSYFRNVDVIDKLGSQTGRSSEAGKKPCGTSQPQKGRELKIVVFVHGFQASLLFIASLRLVDSVALSLWVLICIFIFKHSHNLEFVIAIPITHFHLESTTLVN